MKHSFLLSLLLIVLSALTCKAQISFDVEPLKHKKAKSGKKQFLKKVDNTVLSFANKTSFDPNYVTRPEKKWKVTLYGSETYSTYRLRIPCPDIREDILAALKHSGYATDDINFNDMPGYKKLSTYDLDLYSSKQAIQLGLHYMGLGVKYSFNLNKGHNRQISIEYLGARFGGYLDYHHTTRMKGNMYDASAGALDALLNRIYHSMDNTIPEYNPSELIKENTKKIAPQFNNQTILHAQVHYIFNYRKFSYAAAKTANRIQKRSAGSCIALADYYQNRAYFDQSIMINDGERFRTNKLALGFGYGYNWTPNRGKLLVHASFIPSINVLCHSVYKRSELTEEQFNKDKLEYENESGPGSYIYQTYDDAKKAYSAFDKRVTNCIKDDTKLALNCTGRLSVIYNINKEIVAGIFGSMQYSHHANQHDYYIKELNTNVLAFVGYRF